MAGGQATNSGIDYQQRVSAWCLINQFAEYDLSIFFDQLDEGFIIKKTLFETDRPIDDLNLFCSNNKSIFFQIKRNISLSEKNTSDFYKAIDQLVLEFVKNEYSENVLGLVTSSVSSSKITNDLKKIVNSIKLNQDAFKDNPLNKSEKETFEKFYSIFGQIYKNYNGKSPSEKSFILFINRFLIGIIDIQSGHPIEIAALILLKSLGFKNPESIWAIMIKNALTYATNRQSIELTKLKKIFEKYKTQEELGDSNRIADELKTEIISQGEFSVLKEVILAKSPTDDLDLILFESERFNENCENRFVFYDDNARNLQGVEFKLVQRFATQKGVERFIEDDPEKYKNQKIAILIHDGLDKIQENDCTNAHKAYLEKLIKENRNILLCLHCEKSIISKKSLLVEIDDLNSAPAVGIVHNSCLRPIDRILGVPKIPGWKKEDRLDSFDYKLWVSLIMKGQGMLNSLKNNPKILHGRNSIISWNSNDQYNNDYSYCIKFILEDGTSTYAYQRGRIHRLNLLQAEADLESFKNVINSHEFKEDPYCFLSISKVTGPYSEMIKMKKMEDVIQKVVSVEIAKYSKLIAKVFDNDIQYYSPLCLLRDVDTELILNLNNVIPIISDPLIIDDIIKNWEMYGFKMNNFELKIIESDRDFDAYMRMFFEDNFYPIIDPYFDKNFELIKGFPIQEYNKMVMELEMRKKK